VGIVGTFGPGGVSKPPAQLGLAANLLEFIKDSCALTPLIKESHSYAKDSG